MQERVGGDALDPHDGHAPIHKLRYSGTERTASQWPHATSPASLRVKLSTWPFAHWSVHRPVVLLTKTPQFTSQGLPVPVPTGDRIRTPARPIPEGLKRAGADSWSAEHMSVTSTRPDASFFDRLDAIGFDNVPRLGHATPETEDRVLALMEMLVDLARRANGIKPRCV